MIRCSIPYLVGLVSLAVLTGPVIAAIDGTAHDLSAVGGGNVCSFCHTPHGAAIGTPLWSHELSRAVYKIYQSSSLEAEVGQPTGSSKLCLSCHDGTVALNQTVTNPGGSRTLSSERANLGTDLSDDHPVSFTYSQSLSGQDPQLHPAASLPEELKLDRDGELQCTTCHDPHDDQYGKFLVMPNERSAMCTACHDKTGWRGSIHESAANSVAASGDAYLRSTGYATVAANGCLSCHRTHSAGGHERLLHFDKLEDNCLSCHDGSVAQTDLRRPLEQFSRHDVRRYDDVHDPTETAFSTARHVECADCHNPHACKEAGPDASPILGPLAQVSGVTATGAQTPRAEHEYEVCFKCHADNPNRPDATVTRAITQTNTRLEFGPSAVSRHPVVTTGVNQTVPSLKPPLTVSSRIRCTDCHSSDSSSGVKGPHGSQYVPLLRYNYQTHDYTSESEYAYALCYRCHSRNSILDNESFPHHKKHLKKQTPCSACHDPHGISSAQGTSSSNSHLINFDINIVQADPDTGRLEFIDDGTTRGRCYLLCHGKKHSPKRY